MNLAQTWDYYRDQFTTWIMHFGMPVVHIYHLICSSIFLNTAAEDATGLEKWGNWLLTPTQYLLAGNTAVIDERLSLVREEIDGKLVYRFEQRFDYNDRFIWVKTATSLLALPVSLVLGSTVKAISYAFEPVRKRHEQIAASLQPQDCLINNEPYYVNLGLPIGRMEQADWLQSPIYERRPGDENTMKIDKVALKEIVQLLTENHIPFWLDCGTCLGAYRYRGIIPWDWDLDIAILQPDFDNVYKLLKKLNPEKYAVQDWSSRDKPKTYLKVYVKETGCLIDIYHFGIDPKTQTIHSILSNENSIFLTEGWRTRERRFVIPTPYDWVFPLKKVEFDGIVAFIPNQTEKYLKQRYGENISPAKIFNAATNRYEKDLNHPYWKQAYAH